MALKIGLVVRTEFLRLVLRQLLRREVGVDVVGEVDCLNAAIGLRDAEWMVIEKVLYDEDPENQLPLCSRVSNQIVLIVDGAETVASNSLISKDIILIPAGTSELKLDPSALSMRLNATLKSLQKNDQQVIIHSKPIKSVELVSTISLRKATLTQRPTIIGIAVSTGGPDALQELFLALKAPLCPIIVALHIPKEHTSGLAHHLTNISGHSIIVTEAGPLPPRGVILLQGGTDYGVVANTDGFSLQRVRGGTSSFHPNANILLTSMAKLNQPSVGIILTGMGDDGSEGVKAFAAQGFPVFAQRPSSCAVAGMPSAAIATGAVSYIATPSEIGIRINDLFLQSEPTQNI